MVRRFLIAAEVLFCVTLAGACASSDVPRPTALDAERAKATWPEASLESLTEGRRLYLGHCASCHRPFAPATRTASEWRHQVGEMQVHAGLDPERAEIVLRYLALFAREAPPSP